MSTILAALCASLLLAQDSAGLKTRSGKRQVRLWPPASQPTTQPVPDTIPEAVLRHKVGGWDYRAERSSQVRDGVPWELIVTPDPEQKEKWQQGMEGGTLPPLSSFHPRRGDVLIAPKKQKTLAIEVPEVVWKKWLAPELYDVVGIHFHEVVAEDTARILYTIHRVPPGNEAGDDGKSRPMGCRIEATLLAPLVFHLDQTIVVRDDALKKDKAASRAAHELGHADVSQAVFIAVLRGRDEWNPEKSTGHRTKLAYYWKREAIGRKWREFRGGAKKVRATRTSVALVPPTRWSKMLPIPPERVTQKHLQDFNDEIINVSAHFNVVDAQAQAKFHAEHGAYESGD